MPFRRRCRLLTTRAPTSEWFGALPPRAPLPLHRQGHQLIGQSGRLGAVVDVGDLRNLNAAGAAVIKDAVRAHGVVVCKSQNLERAEQVAVTDKLGETIVLPKSFEGNDPEPKHPAIQRITNFWADGRWKGPEWFAGAYWHQDGQFWKPPLHNILSLLYGHRTPPSGGETGFVDLRAARASLPSALAGRAANASVRASVWQIGDFANGDPSDLAAFPDVTHPMLDTHLLDDGPILYVGSKHMGVEAHGETDEGGKELLRALLDHATTTPSFQYFHPWEAGDLLIWDNTQVLHHSMPYENNGVNVREYYRTQARMVWKAEVERGKPRRTSHQRLA